MMTWRTPCHRFSTTLTPLKFAAHADDWQHDAVGHLMSEWLDFGEAERGVQRNARQRRRKLEVREAVRERGAGAGVVELTCESAARPRRMHEERANSCRISCGIERRVG